MINKREKERKNQEALGQFFYNLALLAFGGAVIGGIVGLDLTKSGLEIMQNVLRVVVGCFVTCAFAMIGNNIYNK